MNDSSLRRKGPLTVLFAVAALFFIPGLVTADSISKIDVVKAMVQFDQAYIPFLALTNKGDAGGAKKAMNVLVQEWAVLQPDMRAMFGPADPAQKSLSDANSIISLAVEKMGENAPLPEIHETLEGIKTPFVELRKAHGIAYYPDLLDAYHTTMEEMLAKVGSKQADQIDASALRDIRTLAETGQKEWSTIASAPFDAALYGFSPENTASLRTSIEQGQAQEANFLRIVESGDVATMLQESGKLKPSYTQVFLQFGNFARLKS